MFIPQGVHFDGVVQERHNSIANALALHLSCTNPSIWLHHNTKCSNGLENTRLTIRQPGVLSEGFDMNLIGCDDICTTKNYINPCYNRKTNAKNELIGLEIKFSDFWLNLVLF